MSEIRRPAKAKARPASERPARSGAAGPFDTTFSRQHQRQSKRDAVLREAALAFRRRGFHATSMEEIAESLGVTKGALYRYVKSKHEVLYECCKLAEALGDHALAVAGSRDGSGHEKLACFFGVFIDKYLRSNFAGPAMVDIDALEPAQKKDVVRGRDRVDRGIRRLVEEGIADGSIKPCDPKLAVLVLMGSVNWMPSWYAETGPLSPTDIASRFVELFVSGLSNAPVAAASAPAAAASKPRGRKSAAKAA